MLVVTIAVGMLSCQKVISVDLNQSNPQIVIEGLINDQGGLDSVVVTMTGDYFTPSLNFPPVNAATVTIADGGQIDTLSEAAAGIYYSTNPRGISGRTYALKVTTAGKVYDAVSTMPEKVIIDSFFAEKSLNPFGESGYDFYITFKDPPELGNYYRIVPHVNSLPPDSITGGRGGFQITDDKLTNGNEITYMFGVRGEVGSKLKPGDTVSVDLECIDKATYDYYFTLRNILEADQSPTSLSPANPNTNLSNGSLGYFSAYTIDTRSLVIQ